MRFSRLLVTAAPAALAGLVVMWATATLGPGTEPDSAQYICAAQSLLARGAMCDCGSTWPFIHFPPLYSVMLAAGIRLGIAPLTVGRFIAAGSCAASIFMMGLILEAATGSLLVALSGQFLMMWTVGISYVFLYAMSEPPFDLMLLLFVFYLSRAIGDERRRYLVAAAATAAGAALIRYVGVSLLATGAFALLCLGPASLTSRIRRAALFLVVGATPVAAWFLRNRLETHSIGRPVSWHSPPGGYWLANFGMIARWFIPSLRGTRAYVFGVVLSLVLIAILIGLEWTSTNSLEWLMVNLIVTYAATLLLTRSLMDATIFLNNRMMAPIALIALMLVLFEIHRHLRRAGLARACAISLGIVVGLVVINSGSTPSLVYQSRVGGLGCTRRDISDSEMMRRLRDVPAEAPIYSDDPAPITLFGAHVADGLPLLRDPRSGAPSRRYAGELAAMQQRLGQTAGVIAYFYLANRHSLDNIPTPADMPATYQLSMRKVFDGFEGMIFEARAPTR